MQFEKVDTTMVDSSDLELPFFARSRTKRFVDELGHLDNLCIFAGSGVSVDRTGLIWDDLICHLLEAVGSQPDHANRLVGALGPMRAGSVAVQRYYERWGRSNWQIQLANKLREVLYDKRDWLGGNISKAIAELYVEYMSVDKHIHVVTTNYDQHTEFDIIEAQQIWNQQLSHRGVNVDPISVGTQPVVYLHGVVPPNGEVVNFPVVSERDYFERSSTTEDNLRRLFENNNLLIIGSGLTDPPLLNALLSTRRCGHKRIAIVSRSSLSAVDSSPASGDIINSHEDRLHHFAVDGLYFDYFSQVAQLLAEIRIASTLAPQEYPLSEKRHGSRLQMWWGHWFANVSSPEKFAELQQHHHERLVEKLEEIREDLGAKDESLKLEVWMRWQPSNSNREFRLWASSFAKFRSWQMARSAHIDAASRYACIKAFAAGRAVYEQNNDATERWKTFIALPIEADGEVNLVVGAVVIGSMTTPSASCLCESRRGNHAEALLKATQAAADMTAGDLVR